MSSPWVIAAPEYVAAAASDLANIGSSLSTANMAALMPTSGVMAAGGDEVSAMIAALFSSHAQAYHALSQQAAAFHAQFVQLMNTGGSQYALQEAANASPLLETLGQDAAGAVNSSISALTGTPWGGGGVGAAPVVGGHSASAASAASVAKPMPAASVPAAAVSPLTGIAGSNASTFAAPGGGGGVSGGLLPSSAASLANPVATAGVGGAGGSGSFVSTSPALTADASDGGMGGAPVASPLLNTVGTSAPNAAPPPGSGGVSENSGNGGTSRLGSEAAGGEEASAASGDASGAGAAEALRPSAGSFYPGADGAGTGTAAAAEIPS